MNEPVLRVLIIVHIKISFSAVNYLWIRQNSFKFYKYSVQLKFSQKIPTYFVIHPTVNYDFNLLVNLINTKIVNEKRITNIFQLL